MSHEDCDHVIAELRAELAAANTRAEVADGDVHRLTALLEVEQLASEAAETENARLRAMLANADREQAEFHQLVGELKTEWGVNGYRDLNHEVCIIPVPEARARLVVDEAVMSGQTGITLVARRVGEWRPAGDATPDGPGGTDAAALGDVSNAGATPMNPQETDHA